MNKRSSETSVPGQLPNGADAAAESTSPYLWLPYVLPLLVYMLSDYLPLDGLSYALSYSLRVGLTLAACLVALPIYRQFPLRVSFLSVIVGMVGGLVWIIVCRWHLEALWSDVPGLGGFLSSGQRAAYNPYEALHDSPASLAMFFAVRFFGLVLLIPLIEEFFLRGFLMRFVVDQQWQRVPFGQTTLTSILVGTAYGILAHPAEMLAAALWFSLITWLMIKTRNIWDCVLAHAVTNLMLGVYVVVWQDWRLW
jgi:uncharacterized protein